MSSKPTPSAIPSAVVETIAGPKSESPGFGRNRGGSGGSGFGSPPARVGYALCYYANLQTLRSVCFGLSVLALLALLILGVSASLG